MSAAQQPFHGPAATRARVVAVSRDSAHRFSKPTVPAIRLLQGLGVEGDAHCGARVQHRSRVRRDPGQPNLRQVHLVHAELFDEVAAHGHQVAPGQMGENLTTWGVDLLGLPRGALLRVGAQAEVEVTGLRNPCYQIEVFQHGLLGQMVGVDKHGRTVRRAGVMGVVRRSGTVRPGDPVVAVLPDGPHHRLEPV